MCVYFFICILLLLSQHAPLHCVILHARFFLIELLSLDICSLIHVLLQFFEVYRVSKVCKLFKYLFTNSHFRTGQSSSLDM